MKAKKGTTLSYVLESFIPYTEANLKLNFKPSLFFNDLEKISHKKSKTLKNAYYRAIKKGLIEIDDEGIPRLTEKGRSKTKLFKPETLSKNVRLLVVFDIPEEERYKRRRLRLLLRELSFKQVQKSVWATKYNYKEYLQSAIKEENLSDYVVMFEAVYIK